MKNFHKQTEAKSNHARFLFVDGHKSHCTIEALEFAKAHNIVVISYPPHTTHALQGLDVACFGALKTYWGHEKSDYETVSKKRVSKANFLQVYSPARKRAFTVSTIASAFRATGLVPFNRNIITDAQMAPAKENCARGTFAVTLPTPARALVSAHRRYLMRSDGSEAEGSSSVSASGVEWETCSA